MPRTGRTLALAAFLAIVGSSCPHRANAQYVVAPSRTVVMEQPNMAIATHPGRVVTPTGPFTAFRSRREARRDKRARYLAMRPAYSTPTGNRIGFAPFSDRYVGSSTTVVTPPPPYTVQPR